MADSLPPSTKVGQVIDLLDCHNNHVCSAKVRAINFYNKKIEVEYIDGPEDGRKVELPFSHFTKSGEQ
jgi:hypothetical protein